MFYYKTCVVCIIQRRFIVNSFFWFWVYLWWCMFDGLHICDMTHSYVWHDSFTAPSNIYSYVSWCEAAEYSLFYRALLQKRPIILRSLLIVSLYSACLALNNVLACLYVYAYTRYIYATWVCVIINSICCMLCVTHSACMAPDMGWLRLVNSLKL